MAVARSLSKTTDSSLLDRHSDALGDQFAAGRMPMDIARRLYPHDRKKRLAAYMRFRRAALSDERTRQRVLEDVQISELVGIGPAARALAGRAARGRVDAIKLLFEVSGHHNPRVQHEHSGDIKISLTIPRPDRERKAIDVPEADVVED